MPKTIITGGLPMRWATVVMALVVVGVGLRAAQLGSDAPSTYPNGFRDQASLKDEAEKCYPARNRVRFGAWRTSEADDHLFWNYLAPAWTHALGGWFAVFGPEYRSARLLSIAWSGITILALTVALGRRRRRAGMFAGAFFAVNFYAVIMGRMGLMDAQVTGLLVIGFAALRHGRRRPAWFAAAAASWLLAYYTKPSASVFLPALAAAGLMAARTRPEDTAPPKWDWRPPALLAAAAAAVAAPYFISDAYRFRFDLTSCHSLALPRECGGWGLGESIRYKWNDGQFDLLSGLWNGWVLMVPVAGPLALLQIIGTAARSLKTRKLDPTEALLALWWLSARATLLIQGMFAVRFYFIQVPPTVLLAGLFLERLLAGTGTVPAYVRRAMAVALLAAAAIFHGALWINWVKTNPRNLQTANRAIEDLIGDRPAVLIGEWAPAASFDTPYLFYYVKPPFNQSRDRIRALGVTHLLVENKDRFEFQPTSVRLFQKFFPTAFAQARLIGQIEFREEGRQPFILYLFEVDMDLDP